MGLLLAAFYDLYVGVERKEVVYEFLIALWADVNLLGVVVIEYESFAGGGGFVSFAHACVGEDFVPMDCVSRVPLNSMDCW